ncbi:hypothetical protein BLX87_02630 [Bacillus sp. VT-16-64]|nr:hypothetical protein BLX87_02630 [Bacillus sp. VT-16-64]
MAIGGDDGLQTPLACALNAAGIRVHSIPALGNTAGVAGLAQAVGHLQAIVRKQSPDLVHAHSAMAGVAARLAGARTRKPVIYTVHGFAFKAGNPWKRRVAAFAAEWLLAPLARRMVCVSVQLGHLFNRKGDLKAAFVWYEKALQLAPDDREIARHVNIARNGSSRPGLDQSRRDAMRLVEENKWSQARAALHALVVDNGQTDMIAVFANVTKEDGDFDAALKLYGQYRDYANAFNPDSLEDVEVQLGHLHKIAGDYRTALTHYIRARNAEEHSIYGGLCSAVGEVLRREKTVPLLRGGGDDRNFEIAPNQKIFGKNGVSKSRILGKIKKRLKKNRP